jgi:outer membrane protein assembly factor BamB
MCPACGRPVPANLRVCRYCWAAVGDAAVLSDAESAQVLAAEESAEAADRAQRRGRRVAYLAAAALVLLLAYRLLLAPIPPLPLPSSPVRSVELTPERWPIVGGDTGAARVTAADPALSGELAWRVQVDSPIVWPVIADERAVYVVLEDSALLALSTEDGGELWRMHVPGRLDAPPTVAGDRLYVGFRDGRVVAVDATNGEMLWERSTGRSFATSPVVASGVVYALSLNQIRAFDAENGDEIWTHDLDTTFMLVPPVLVGERLAVATHDRVLFFDLKTGDETFFYSMRRPLYLAISEGKVFALSQRGMVVFDIELRRPWWEPFRRVWGQFDIWKIAPRPVPVPPRDWLSTAPSDALAPVLSSGQILIATESGRVESHDLFTGALLWERMGSPLVGDPVMTSSGLLLTAADALVLLDPQSGAEIASRPFEGLELRYSTVTSGGTYLVAGADELLVLR